MSVAEQRKDNVAACIDVVNREEQFSKTRLSEIVGEKFDIPAREIGCRRRRDWRRAPDQIP